MATPRCMARFRRRKNGEGLSGSTMSMWISPCRVSGNTRGTPSWRAACTTFSRVLTDAVSRSLSTRSTVVTLTPASAAISVKRAVFLRRLGLTMI